MIPVCKGEVPLPSGLAFRGSLRILVSWPEKLKYPRDSWAQSSALGKLVGVALLSELTKLPGSFGQDKNGGC